MACPIPRRTRIRLAYRQHLLRRLDRIRARLADNRDWILDAHRLDGWDIELAAIVAEMRDADCTVGTSSETSPGPGLGRAPGPGAPTTNAA